jgi:hypothetical protein
MTPEQRAKADAVAAQLNLAPAEGFDGDWTRVFTLPDGGRLYFSSGRQRGQLHISASVPNDLREHRPYYREGEAPKTSVNVSESKDAQRIAADGFTYSGLRYSVAGPRPTRRSKSSSTKWLIHAVVDTDVVSIWPGAQGAVERALAPASSMNQPCLFPPGLALGTAPQAS